MKRPSALDLKIVTCVGRDLPVYNVCSNYQSIIKHILVQKGVNSLEVPIGISMAGRLALYLDNWSKVTQDQWVLNTVQGYRLELLREPV